MRFVAKEGGLGYNGPMDILARLETEVRGLVAANRGLKAELDRVEAECAALQAENLAMRRDLEAGRQAREQALARVDTLMGVVADRLGAERLS